MSNNQNTLLCDIGGTHARFARLVSNQTYDNFQKYRLNDFSNFESIIRNYLSDTGLSFSNARFSVARTPVNGRIEYKRHAGDPDYVIDFNIVKDTFGWNSLSTLNDLEAAAHGVKALTGNQIKTVIPSASSPWNNDKIIISVGTGVGHAGIMNGQIMRTCGGHWLPITVTETHRKIENFIRIHKDKNMSLIMEDFISGHGLRSITEYVSGISNDDMTPDEFLSDLKNQTDAIRLFFEFLGIYAHAITSITGFYGGVYLTGGVIDNLIKHNLVDWDAFQSYFQSKMVSVVDDRLSNTAIYHVLHDELPLLGLTQL